jgi:hypothetical protein
MVLAAPASGQGFIQGSFIADCPFTHRAPDDPIVHPGHKGASHMHDFIGNPTTNAFSTLRSLLGAEDRCSRPADRSAYWVPTLYRGSLRDTRDASGNPAGITPIYSFAYYIAGGKDNSTIEPFPRGLRVIAGNPNAYSSQNYDHVAWYCETLGVQNLNFRPQPPACVAPQRLVARILFPDCSNGRVDSRNHRRHMTYADYKTGEQIRTCPPSHPIPVPQLVLFVVYPAAAGHATQLSSGSRYSMHADFIEAWKGRSMQRLIDLCIATGLECGVYPN